MQADLIVRSNRTSVSGDGPLDSRTGESPLLPHLTLGQRMAVATYELEHYGHEVSLVAYWIGLEVVYEITCDCADCGDVVTFNRAGEEVTHG